MVVHFYPNLILEPIDGEYIPDVIGDKPSLARQFDREDIIFRVSEVKGGFWNGKPKNVFLSSDGRLFHLSQDKTELLEYRVYVGQNNDYILLTANRQTYKFDYPIKVSDTVKLPDCNLRVSTSNVYGCLPRELLRRERSAASVKMNPKPKPKAKAPAQASTEPNILTKESVGQTFKTISGNDVCIVGFVDHAFGEILPKRSFIGMFRAQELGHSVVEFKEDGSSIYASIKIAPPKVEKDVWIAILAYKGGVVETFSADTKDKIDEIINDNVEDGLTLVDCFKRTVTV